MLAPTAAVFSIPLRSSLNPKPHAVSTVSLLLYEGLNSCFAKCYCLVLKVVGSKEGDILPTLATQKRNVKMPSNYLFRALSQHLSSERSVGPPTNRSLGPASPLKVSEPKALLSLK